MKKDSGSVRTGGIGFCGLLGVAFIVLKLIGVIGWPWVWVLSPIWIAAALNLAVLAVVFLCLWVKGK